MKKILLFSISIVLCSTLLAQQHKVANTKELYKGVEVQQFLTYSVSAEQYVDFIPSYSPSMLHSKALYVNIVGETHYNSPTNNCARNTVSFRPNTTNAAAVWTMAPTGGTPPDQLCPLRGTGINHFTNGDWDIMPNTDSRIEDVKTGWGVHAFTQEGEIVVSHNGLVSLESGLVVSTRDKWGEGDWNQYTLNGPEYLLASPAYNSPDVATTGIQWPSMATNGDVVHLICVTAQWGTLPSSMDQYPEGYASGYLGFPTVPLYYRSSDGGKTWDKKAIDFRAMGMTDIEVQRTSADAYSIAVKGDHVVFVYHEHYHFIYYMESRDGGNTWVKKEVYDFDFDWSPNTWQQPRIVPATTSIYIDDSDRVHIAFGTRLHARGPDQAEGWYVRYTNFPTGIVYWNDSFDPMSWEELSATTIAQNSTELDTDNQDQWAFKNHPRYIEVPSVLGFDQFYYWEGSPSYNSNQFRDLGFCLFPRIIAKNDKVYVSYQAPIEYPLIFPSGAGNLLRGIFVTVSMDDGETMNSFENTSWVSYYPQVFMCKWDDYSGPQYTEGGDPFWDGTITISWSAENAYPTMSMNTSSDNNFIIQWNNQYEPFLTTGTIVEEPISVFTLMRNLNIFPAYNNIRNVHKGECQNPGVSEIPTIKTEIYPNPVTEGIVFVKVDTNSPYTITVTNILGQVVNTSKGISQITELNISNLISGIYIVNVKTDKATSTQKLIVR